MKEEVLPQVLHALKFLLSDYRAVTEVLVNTGLLTSGHVLNESQQHIDQAEKALAAAAASPFFQEVKGCGRIVPHWDEGHTSASRRQCGTAGYFCLECKHNGAGSAEELLEELLEEFEDRYDGDVAGGFDCLRVTDSWMGKYLERLRNFAPIGGKHAPTSERTDQSA